MIFVTGANGLLGSFICRKFLSEGEKIRALKREDSDMALVQDIKHQIDWVEGDILDIPLLEKYLKDVDTVIHCAAIVSYDGRDRSKLYKINIEGTANVVNACLNAGVQRLLHVSSVAAIGKGKDVTSANENSKWVDSEGSSTYGKTKYLAELEVWRGAMEGLKTLIINPSVVIGPGDWNKTSTRIFKYIWEEKSFYTKGSLNYVDIRDVADILFNLYSSGVSGERFIVNAGAISYKSLFDKIALNFGKRPPHIPVTRFLINLAIAGSKIKSLFTGKAPFITRELGAIADKTFLYENKKIVNTLNYKFRPIDDTIAWTCKDILAINT